jgi:para-nitrobenzyl esterase
MNRVLGRHVPVHAYEFSDQTAPSYVGPTTFPLLAAHTLELPYLFPGFRGGGEAVVKLNPLQEKLSDEMVGYFANVGQLSAGVGEWTRYDAQRDNVMTFSLPKAGMVDGKYADFHHCGFWDRTGVY